MKKFPENFKTWLEATSCFALIISLFFAVVVYIFQINSYISAKKDETESVTKKNLAKEKEITEKISIMKDLKIDYSNQLETLENDIEKINQELQKEPFIDNPRRESLLQFRKLKIQEKQELTNTMWNQIGNIEKIELKKE